MHLDEIMYLLSQTHWANKRHKETVEKSIEGSLCFGVFDENDVQIGFGRAVTDYATMFYISDVVIDKDHQGLGLGSKLVSFIKSAPELEGLWGFLGTTAAEGFYSKQGFTRSTGFFMTLPKTNQGDIFSVRQSASKENAEEADAVLDDDVIDKIAGGAVFDFPK